jgi:pSer/pThr/pTyr-binding forkhead associated (FHA) protein
MMVILEATAGPITGRRIEVRAGVILRIGRTPKSDYAVGEDSYLSSLHFAIECDGERARVRDLGSSNGTFLNGNKVAEETLKEGDSVMAGGSTFVVHLAETAPPITQDRPALARTAPTPIMTVAQTRIDRPSLVAGPAPVTAGFSRGQLALINALYSAGESVFAVLDAARDSRIPAFLEASGELFAPLDASGRTPVFVAAPAPDSRLLDVLVKDGWGHGWCSYFTARASPEEVCAHLALYLTLYTANALPITFRFWDSRVLRAMAPQMHAEEAAAFFGPCARIIFEGEKPEIGIELSLTARGTRQHTLVLL